MVPVAVAVVVVVAVLACGKRTLAHSHVLLALVSEQVWEGMHMREGRQFKHADG